MSRRLSLRGALVEACLGLVFLVELGPEGSHLPSLEVGDLDGAPALGGAGHGGEHELEDGFLAEGVGDDLQAPALLEDGVAAPEGLRSSKLVVRVAWRWVTGSRRCAMQASKSSVKQATALGSWLS